MKSKVLIIMPYLECGGVESTLLSLLGVLDAKRVEITLLLLEERGTFIEKVPSHIQIKTINIPEKEQGIFYGKEKNVTFIFKKRENMENSKIYFV